MTVDVEAMLTRHLRAQPSVTSFVDDRVYTDLPHQRAYPLVLVQRTGGGPLFSRPANWLDEAEMTLDFYGGTHKMAQSLMAAAMTAIGELPGQQPEGVVTTIRSAIVTYTPEDESPDEVGHARPRFQVRVNVVTHP